MLQLPLTALLAGALAGGPGLDAPPPEPLVAPAVDAVDDLSTAYDEATKAWRDALRAADGAEAKREIRKAHPAKEFYPRFEELFTGGQHRAAVWMIANARYTDLSRKDAEETARGLYTKLFGAKDAQPAALREAAERLLRDRKLFEPDQAVALLEGAFEATSDRETKATLAFSAGRFLMRAGGEHEAAGMRWMDRVVEEFGDTEVGAQAEDMVFERKFLSVGATAPVFGGKTIEGEELKLEDYRGNIVVLDFFGFW